MAKERDKEKEKEKDAKAETLNHLSIHQWVRSLCRFCATATHLSYRFPIFETSATALCGTTGKPCPHDTLMTTKGHPLLSN